MVPHVYRKTVATMLDPGGLSARMIADQLGHSRMSMTQDVYLGRRTVDGSVASALEGLFDVPGPGEDPWPRGLKWCPDRASGATSTTRLPDGTEATCHTVVVAGV